MSTLGHTAVRENIGSGKAAMVRHKPCIIPKTMSEKTFRCFQEYIQANIGIKMPDVKKTMLQSRLQKRLRALGISTFEAYYDYVFGEQQEEKELIHMIDAVTTNKTDFFREPHHFEYLVQTVLPFLMSVKTAAAKKNIRFWSAGCSTGAEPYTLAMVLNDFGMTNPKFGHSILATDISSKVLQNAALGIYDEEMIVPIPAEFRKRYLLKSKNRNNPTFRIIPELRSSVYFKRLNFMDEYYDLNRPLDIVFCRNVLIYFSRSTQEKVINRICRYLADGGFLFVGHSETLNGLDVPLSQVKPTIYSKRNET